MKMKKTLLFTLLSVIALWAGSQRALALDQQDGVYQIGNAQDLEDFSNMVASGNGSISGALTADIDLAGVKHLPIGTVSSPFSGSFDGQQHFIRNMQLDLPEEEYVGLFGVLNDGAYIKNVIVGHASSPARDSWLVSQEAPMAVALSLLRTVATRPASVLPRRMLPASAA